MRGFPAALLVPFWLLVMMASLLVLPFGFRTMALPFGFTFWRTKSLAYRPSFMLEHLIIGYSLPQRTWICDWLFFNWVNVGLCYNFSPLDIKCVVLIFSKVSLNQFTIQSEEAIERQTRPCSLLWSIVHAALNNSDSHTHSIVYSPAWVV